MAQLRFMRVDDKPSMARWWAAYYSEYALKKEYSSSHPWLESGSRHFLAQPVEKSCTPFLLAQCIWGKQSGLYSQSANRCGGLLNPSTMNNSQVYAWVEAIHQLQLLSLVQMEHAFFTSVLCVWGHANAYSYLMISIHIWSLSPQCNEIIVKRGREAFSNFPEPGLWTPIRQLDSRTSNDEAKQHSHSISYKVCRLVFCRVPWNERHWESLCGLAATLRDSEFVTWNLSIRRIMLDLKAFVDGLISHPMPTHDTDR